MALVLYPDGTSKEVQPQDGHSFQLKELQAIVEGHIEIIPTRDRRIMILNEEGKLQDLPYNQQATALVHFSSPEELRELAKNPNVILVGDLDEADYIVGTVLVCEDEEVR